VNDQTAKSGGELGNAKLGQGRPKFPVGFGDVIENLAKGGDLARQEGILCQSVSPEMQNSDQGREHLNHVKRVGSETPEIENNAGKQLCSQNQEGSRISASLGGISRNPELAYR
jgi:hypothetical protein